MNQKVKKSIGAVLLVSIFMIAAIGSGSKDDSSENDSGNSNGTKEKITLESKTEESTESPVEIVSQKLSKDYNDKDVLIVEYAFTNTSDKAASFVTTVTDKAFQNGVELDSTVMGCDDYDAGDQLKDVQPGVTFNVECAYILEDMSDVNIVVKEWIGSTEYLNETIALS